MIKWEKNKNQGSWDIRLDQNHILNLSCGTPNIVTWYHTDKEGTKRLERFTFKTKTDNLENIQKQALRTVYNRLWEQVYMSEINMERKEDEEMLWLLSSQLKADAKYEDKAMICKLLVQVYRQTRQFSDLVNLKYEKDDKTDEETVTVVFANGAKRRINVTMDSGWRMIQDIANHIDG